MNFSAVILAGGRSSRMGRDKALLPFDGQTLLARQIELIRELAPAELFISGRADADYTSFVCPVLTDRFPDAGPLAGIAAALAAAGAPLVLVLAVDLPQMTRNLLRRLLDECSADTGVVPQVNQHVEPLAAVYPRAAQPIAVDLLQRGQRAVRTFAEQCRQSRQGCPNWNRNVPALVGIRCRRLVRLSRHRSSVWAIRVIRKIGGSYCISQP